MMQQKIVIATSNRGKFKEIKDILKKVISKGCQFISLRELRTVPKIVENGKTYRANAFKKAKKIGDLTGLITIADDSGLEVKILGNKPGIHSARFAGKNANDKRNNEKLLKLLDGVPFKKRKAQFVCSAVAYLPHIKKFITTTGKVKGYITFAQVGKNGFGYDPLFYYPPFKKTFAQISREQKNKISHRALAFMKLGSRFKVFIKEF